MRISELIKLLEDIQYEHGDIFIEDGGGTVTSREQWEAAFSVREVDEQTVTQFDADIAGKVKFDA